MKLTGKFIIIICSLFISYLLAQDTFASGGPTVIDTIRLANGPALNHPGPIDVNLNDGCIFVASNDGGNIIKYDPVIKQIKGELRGFLYPECISVVDNELYVASFNESWVPGIYIYDAQTLTSIKTIPSINWYIYSMRVDKQNDLLYYGTFRTVHKVNLADNSQEVLLDLGSIGINDYNIFPSCINIDSERERLYITCAYTKADSTLHAFVINFDLKTKSVIATIPIGQNPAGFDYRYDCALDDYKLFITQMYACEITVVDVVNNVVLHTIPDVSWPQKLTLNHDKDRLYVVDNYADKFHIIDTNNLVLVKSLCPGDDPSGVCVDTVRNRAYTANHWSQDVGVVCCIGEKMIERIPFVPSTPLDVIAKDDKLYVTNGPNSGIFILDENKRILIDQVLPYSYQQYYNDLYIAAGVLNVYTGEIVINNHLAYATDEYNQSIGVFDLSERKFIHHLGLGDFPTSIAQENNTIYYPYINNSVLYLAISDGNIIESIQLGNSEKSAGIAVNSASGKAYIADYANNEVVVADIINKTIIKRIQVGSFPVGVSVNEQTNIIYISNYGSNSVAVIDGSNDELLGFIEVGSAPWGIETNSSSNRVYVINSGDNSLTVINGNDNSIAATIQVGMGAKYCGINVTKGLVYVPNQLDGTITVIEDIVATPPPPPPPEDNEPAKSIIKVPKEGDKVSGNAVTVIAEIVEGEASGVLFQYRPSGSTEWVNIADIDCTKPYHVYWNTSELENGDYDLRAIAYDLGEIPDPTPGFISVIVDDVNADIIEDGNPDVNPNIKHTKAQKVRTDSPTEVLLADGTKALVPAGAIKKSAYIIIETVSDVPLPATESVIKPVGVFRRYEFSDGTKMFDRPVQISLPYNDGDCDNIVDGMNVEAADLVIMYLDEDKGEWKAVARQKNLRLSLKNSDPEPRTDPGTVSIETDHFTLFGLFYYSASENLGDIIVYPNPFRPFKGHASITFDGLSANSKLSIHTIAGRPVIELESSQGGTIEWDVKTAGGERVASGVYLYCVTNNKGQKKIGKFAIIR